MKMGRAFILCIYCLLLAVVRPITACEAIDIAFAVPMPRDAASWEYITNFMKSFINDFLPIEDQTTRVAVVTYNYNNLPTTQIRLGQYHNEADVKAAIDQLTYTPDDYFDESSAMQVFEMVFNASQRQVQQAAIIVFGGPLMESLDTVNYAANIQGKNIRVIAIDATSAVDLQTLRKIASKTTDIIQAIGFKNLQIKELQLGRILCQTQSGAVCPKKADIVFLIDESTSIVAAPGAYDNWKVHILGFVEQVIDSFPISQDLTRIGVVKFSTVVDPHERIYLNQYNNSVDLKAAVGAERLNGGETDLADGMRTARTVLFNESNGARTGIPHLLIILTDGKANREADQTVPEANLTKTAGIEIFTIGITSQIDESQLKSICSDPVENHYFYANHYNELNTVIENVAGASCAAAQTLPHTTTAKTTATSPPFPPSTSTTTTPSTTATPTTTTTTTTPTTTTTIPTTTTTTTPTKTNTTATLTTSMSTTTTTTTNTPTPTPTISIPAAFNNQSTESSMVATLPTTSTTNVSDHFPGTTSTSLPNYANSNGAFPVEAIIGIPVLIVIVIAITLIVVYIRKRKPRPTFPSMQLTSGTSSDRIPSENDYEFTSPIVTNSYTNDVPTLSANELKKMRILGRGGYGDVYIAKHSRYGTVAYKETRKACSSNLKVEANIQRKLSHPNIVKLIAIVSDPLEYQGIVLEYVENGDLFEYILTHSPDCGFRCSRIMEVCSGMRYLHSLDPPIIHGDLKIENVLLGKLCEAKICDFGYSKEKEYSGPDSRNSTQRGTCTHIPPEVWANPNLRKIESYDVYSFGILMWETLAGEKPFNGEKSSALIREWILNDFRPEMDKIPHEISANIKKLMKECWDRKAVTRPTFNDIEADFRNLECDYNRCEEIC